MFIGGAPGTASPLVRGKGSRPMAVALVGCDHRGGRGVRGLRAEAPLMRVGPVGAVAASVRSPPPVKEAAMLIRGSSIEGFDFEGLSAPS